MSKEAMKQALEALENTYALRDDVIAAKASLRQAIAEAEDNYQGSDAAKAAHMMDLYTALGVKWGEDPFAVIAKMRSIAEAEKQEPVGWQFYQDGKWHNGLETNNHRANTEASGIPVSDVYTHPQPKRKPLTDEQIEMIWTVDKTSADDCASLYYAKVIARAIEAAHGIKE